MAINILAIESSCDDTSAAIICDGKVLANVVSSQLQHAALGGVVPEVASRAHIERIVPVVDLAFQKSGIPVDEVTAVALTTAPGLLGSLHVGVSFAKAFALAKNIPLIKVNHMDAHIIANLIDEPRPVFPFLCLTVSGGHTQISLVRSPLDIEIIGRTIDDAAGEAFDKGGKMLGLAYPSGPIIDRLAKEGKSKYKFPLPQVNGFDFSFSGIKTAFLYFLRDQLADDSQFIENNINDLAASLQETIIEALIVQLVKAASHYSIREIALAGGVAANSRLRAKLSEAAGKYDWNTYYPAMQYCTDNAGMIGMQGYYQFLAGRFADQSIEASAQV